MLVHLVKKVRPMNAGCADTRRRNERLAHDAIRARRRRSRVAAWTRRRLRWATSANDVPVDSVGSADLRPQVCSGTRRVLLAVVVLATSALVPPTTVAQEGAPVVQGPAGGQFFRLPQFRRGDSNGDGTVDLSDGLAILDLLFLGIHRVTCLSAADTDGSEVLDLSDPVFLFSHLFLGGPTPTNPGPEICGIDRSPTALPCLRYDLCEDPLPLIAHVLNRITFGPTADLYTRIQTREELIDYLDEQLAPPENYDQAIHEPELAAEVAALQFRFVATESTVEKTESLGGLLLLNAIKSEWQLLHVLTQFWNNHFHTQIDTLGQNFFGRNQRGGNSVRSSPELFDAADADLSGDITEAEWATFREFFGAAITWDRFPVSARSDGVLDEEEFLKRVNVSFWKYGGSSVQRGIAAEMEEREYGFFRRHAFSNFSTLLDQTAKSVPMLIYLNTFENTNRKPNENFGREFLELLSLGADNSYTQRDIEVVAEIFTGWTVARVARSLYDPTDLNFSQHPSAERFAINNVFDELPEYLRFPTMENWDDEIFTWAFVFGNPALENGGGHSWDRKDLFLPQFGGVDSIGRPHTPATALTIPARSESEWRVDIALEEFDLLLRRVTSLRDCAKFISTKLIQLFVVDDLALLEKTRDTPADLQASFNEVDTDLSGTLEPEEWFTPIPLSLPNGRPPEIFDELDSDGDGVVTPLEYQEPDLLLDAIAAYEDTDGNILEVVSTILYSDEFLSLKFAGAKVKTPFELVTSTIRLLDGEVDEELLRASIQDIHSAGMELFRFPDPTGESELAIDNMHTVGLLERLRFINGGIRGTTAETKRFIWDFPGVLVKWGLDRPEHVIDFYTVLALGGAISEAHSALAAELSFLPSTEQVAFILSLPQFQKQ